MAKKRWKSAYVPGDIVRFTGPWRFMGGEQTPDPFHRAVEYTVMDAGRYQSQLDDFETPHTLLSPEYPTGAPSGDGRWVDESCIELVMPEPTDEEIAALFGVKPPCPTCHRPF